MNYREETATSTGEVIITPEWDTIHQITEEPTIITLNTPTVPSSTNKVSVIKFTSGDYQPTLNIPDTWNWSRYLDVISNNTYELILSYDNRNNCVDVTGGAFTEAITKSAVVITGTGNATYCYCIINGTTITSATTLELEQGTTVTLCVKSSSSLTSYKSKITIDGTTTQSSGTTALTKTYIVSSNCSIVLEHKTSSSRHYGYITVTTQ